MRIRNLLVLLSILSILLISRMAPADVLYTLEPGSTFQQGCSGPCLCPITLPQEVTGTFLLVPAGSDPLFTNYQLNEVSWTVLAPDGSAAHTITGQGTYKLGGEVALMEELTLDLNIDGGGQEHFDSGLIPGGSEFPSLSIPVSRGTTCFNTWLNIKASPQEKDSLIVALENPANGQRISGVLPIYGWAIDKKGITKVELLIDDQWIADIPYGGTRQDVKNTYPDYPNAENSGFATIWNYSALTAGDHSIKVRAHNQDGQMKDLDTSVTVTRFHGEFVDKMSPSSRLLPGNSVTIDGVTKRYTIKIEWSDTLQGFEITEITGK